MNGLYTIGQEIIDPELLKKIIDDDLKIQIDQSQRKIIAERRNHLLHLLNNSDVPVYGINTGFGALCNTIIPDDQLHVLQINLVRSHACGFGKHADKNLCQLVLLLKIIGLSKGYSAISIELLDFLIALYNAKIYPVMPEMGSLGASGDLAPLAHLSLVCLGEGEVYLNDEIHSASTVLSANKLVTPSLKAKEGLALLNGTQFSLALLLTSYWAALSCYHNANLIASLSIEAFNCNPSFLHPRIHEIRLQQGQIHAADEMRQWLDGSNITQRENKNVQDPYSFRCAPQVHGASFDAIQYCERIIHNEINAVTDNPLMISDNEIISGGNFHAQPIALASDFLSISVAELASISERRLYQLVCGLRGLPDFLTADPGINSGYMIVQYAAAAAVSLNKQLCSPSSVDSIISSKAQEDHVSMAANAGLKCKMIISQTEMVLAMEWMTAARAWHFRKNWKLNSRLQKIWNDYYDIIKFKDQDHIPSLDYHHTLHFLKNIN